MFKYEYAHEKFTAAVQSMAVSPKSLQERIGDAYMYHLHTVETEDLPDEIHGKMEHLREQITRLPATNPDEGKVQATIREMSDEEAFELAQDIVHMADVLEAKYHNYLDEN